MASKILMLFSAGIVLMLGILHLAYTFRGPKLTPRDPAVQARMSDVSLVISKEANVWRCWVGFNATHSMGLILFGLVFGYLASAQGNVLFHSPFLIGVGAAMLIGLVVLSKLYFFSVPFSSVCISLACYVASIVLRHAVSDW